MQRKFQSYPQLQKKNIPDYFEYSGAQISQIADMETWISAGLSISGSCRDSISGRISTSGIAAELRPPRVRDLTTMVEVDSTRLTSLEYVTTGVGSVSRAAGIEADSHGRLLRPTLLDDVVSMILPGMRHYVTYSTENRRE